MTAGYKIRDQSAPHFITTTVVDWIDVFTRKQYRDYIIESLGYSIANKGLVVFAYVIMSNHIHLIVQAQENNLSDLIRDFKKFTSKKILKAIEDSNESRKEWMLERFSKAAKSHSGNKNYQFWKYGSHPEEILTENFLWTKIDYIHLNPVRAGIVERFFKINETNSVHEPIEIEFEKFTENGKGLQCLKVPNIDEMYDCYLAIIPGEILANLYKEFSNELLESNVRAFLGQAGKFNKGIRDTIRNKPQMFLPYNNGITATAESAETELVDGQLVITRLNDFQIVNGGQTTASLYHTQKKYKEVDLSKIFVQMKLTVIKDKEQKNIEVPNISRFANSQNKVSELDLSSNNPYFVQIENLSRKKYVVNPENKNQSLLWFFERANGQYRETLNKQTPSQQKKFKGQNPSQLKFVKSDIAKFINLWELEPHFVAQGSQKNFIQYTKKINELVSKNKLPGENFYRKLIANAILFKTTDKLFGRKNVNAIGDTSIKALTVAYTTSYLHFLTNNRIDLWKIYEEQKIDDFLNNHLKNLLVFVYDHIVSEASGSLISEYAKRATSWEKLKETPYSEDLISVLGDYLISEEEKIQRENEKEIDNNNEENRLYIINEIYKYGLKFWDGFSIYLIKNPLENFNIESIGALIKNLKGNKNLMSRDITIGKKTIQLLSETPSLYDEIKSLSKLPDEEIIEVKFIYDKLLLFSKDDWKRRIDLASQTKAFTNLELANVKSVQTSLAKNENLKEQALIKAYESIKKLKKYGMGV